MVYIYILLLKQQKYYVGKTINPNYRINDHLSEIGSYWTNKYKPLNILCLIDNCDDSDENKYTIETMKKYGINNTRGGIFIHEK